MLDYRGGKLGGKEGGEGGREGGKRRNGLIGPGGFRGKRRR